MWYVGMEAGTEICYQKWGMKYLCESKIEADGVRTLISVGSKRPLKDLGGVQG